jgi:CheY-like chemotaxis protein
VERNHLKNKELFSAVAHEIKNSLNPVINLSSVLLRSSAGRFTPDENSYLEVIERNGKKILNIVEEFSFLIRLSGREKKRDISPVSVREIIDNAVMHTMTLSIDNGCRLVCDIEDSSSIISTENDVFCKIIESICLFFFSLSVDNPSIFFGSSFSDSRFNLTASCKKNLIRFNDMDIFDKEIAVEKGFSRSSLMWLQFAVLYIYHLKGEARFSADDEGNAVFSFFIPADKSETVEHGSESPEITGIHSNSVNEFIMLLIDDDIDNIIPVNAIIENEFKGMGKVYHAESGAAGLDLLEKIQPDIILLDLTLPDISGLSLVKNIKHLFVKKNIPVIAFSALDIAGDKNKMIKAGFDDVIRKPFNIDTFTQKIRKWLD